MTKYSEQQIEEAKKECLRKRGDILNILWNIKSLRGMKKIVHIGEDFLVVDRIDYKEGDKKHVWRELNDAYVVMTYEEAYSSVPCDKKEFYQKTIDSLLNEQMSQEKIFLLITYSDDVHDYIREKTIVENEFPQSKIVKAPYAIFYLARSSDVDSHFNLRWPGFSREGADYP